MGAMPSKIHAEHIDRWLSYDQYDLTHMENLCADYRNIVGGAPTWNEMVSVLIAHGHLEAAEHLMATHQCAPALELSAQSLKGVRWARTNFHMEDPKIPLLHAVIMQVQYHGNNDPHNGRIASTEEILQYIIKNKHWLAQHNTVCEDMTPIMRLLKHMVQDSNQPTTMRWMGRSYLDQGVQARALDLLVALGEDVNATTPQHTSAAAAMSGWIVGGDPSINNSDLQSIKLLQDHRLHLLNALVSHGCDLAAQADSAFVASMRYPLFDSKGCNITAGPHQLPWGWVMLEARGLSPKMELRSTLRDSVWAAAVMSANHQVIKYLVAGNHLPHWVDQDTGNTLWHLTANEGYAASTRSLLNVPAAQLAAVANIANNKGETPMHKVVGTLDIDLVKHLLEAGAKVNVPDRKGYLPFERLRKTGRKAQKTIEGIAELLTSHGDVLAKKKTPAEMLPMACTTLSKDIISTLVNKGADVNIVFKDKLTPLSKVALSTTLLSAKERKQKQDKQLEVAKHLVALGAHIGQADGYGNTLLHWAVQEHLPVLATWCLDSGVDPAHTNLDGLRADQFLKAGSNAFESADWAIIDLFISRGLPLSDGKKPSFAPYKMSYAPLVAYRQKCALSDAVGDISDAGERRKKM